MRIPILFIQAVVDHWIMRTPVWLAPLVAAAIGCGSLGGGVLEDRAAMPAADSSPAPVSDPVPPPVMEFPCDVRAVLETNCAPCHANNTYVRALMTRDAWLAYGSRAAALVAEGKMPPPTAQAQPSPDDQALLLGWVAAGVPAGPCGPLTPPAR